MVSNNTVFSESEGCAMRSLTGYCPKPLESASSFLSKKWTISIITTIGNFKKLRFNQVGRRVPGISTKILAQRLRELEGEKILSRREFAEIPPRVEYSLARKGKELRRALVPLMKWAARE